MTAATAAAPRRPLATSQLHYNEEHVSTVQGFAFTVLCLFLFINFSRVFDILNAAYRIPFTLQLIVIILTFAAGAGWTWFKTKTGKYMMFFSLWVFVCAPLAYWKSGTLDSLYDTARSFALFAVMAGLIVNRRQLRRAIATIAFALVVASLLSFYAERQIEGVRIALQRGSYGDPNAFAMAMVSALPLLLLALRLAEGKPFQKMFYIVCLIVVVLSFARTGSRGGLVGLSGVVIAMFLTGTAAQKLRVLIGTVALGGAALLFVPSVVQERFLAITREQVQTSADDTFEAELEASASSG